MITGEVQKGLGASLDVLRTVGATSLMSQRGAACLDSFLDVIKSLGTSGSCRTEALLNIGAGPPTALSEHAPTSQPRHLPVNSLPEFIEQTTDDFFFGLINGDSYDPYFNV